MTVRSHTAFSEHTRPYAAPLSYLLILAQRRHLAFEASRLLHDSIRGHHGVFYICRYHWSSVTTSSLRRVLCRLTAYASVLIAPSRTCLIGLWPHLRLYEWEMFGGVHGRKKARGRARRMRAARYTDVFEMKYRRFRIYDLKSVVSEMI